MITSASLVDMVSDSNISDRIISLFRTHHCAVCGIEIHHQTTICVSCERSFWPPKQREFEYPLSEEEKRVRKSIWDRQYSRDAIYDKDYIHRLFEAARHCTQTLCPRCEESPVIKGDYLCEGCRYGF